MSRRMPPTPVAAPWYGSMNDGWLWLSILKTTASPSPMSTTPAFSPGPWMTCGPSVGGFVRKVRELLYGQCALHTTEHLPASVRLAHGLRRNLAVLRAVAEDDLVPGLQPGEGRLVGVIVAFAVGDREGQYLAWRAAAGEGRHCVLDANMNVLTDKGKGTVAQHGARQQS